MARPGATLSHASLNVGGPDITPNSSRASSLCHIPLAYSNLNHPPPPTSETSSVLPYTVYDRKKQVQDVQPNGEEELHRGGQLNLTPNIKVECKPPNP